jgi:ABC-2 type transport system ATP-binding protein
VFLDELTTGLDPQARRAIWDLVRGIRQRGKTVFMTTHLMDEAERLCDRVAVIDRGRIVDIGSPSVLIRRHCPERTVVVTTPQESADAVFGALPDVIAVERRDQDVAIRGRGDDLVTDVIQCIAAKSIPVRDFRTESPTLEDVFLTLTGHSVRS